jgi:ADP-heptose:LPS heptosyltransferase/glycosyltransferase involved in cell wall biosynthesis/2-polyprenyl-3-methyl-5-hydroxy-6-metoxy-1,4-benzoquinol methylase
MKSIYGIAVFHNIGDILLCTPIARQLKANEPDCEVVWFTAEKYKFILENNPFIDRVVPFEGEPLTLDTCIPQLKSKNSWTQFFTPAAYMNRDKTPGGSLPQLVKGSVDFAWTVPFVPVMRLSETEKANADAYWNSLPAGKKILIETEFDSQQSPLTQDYLVKLLEVLSPVNPVFIFTAKNKPLGYDQLKSRYSKIIWCQEPFRLNAEFYNRCDAFVGVSSGISCLSNSDICRNDVPHLEISRGYHWSNASYFSRKKELYTAYSWQRFVDGLHWLFNKLTDSAQQHCFSPRFSSESFVFENKDIIPCTVCGSFGFTHVRRLGVVQCNDCGHIYLRERMNRAAQEEFYAEVHLKSQAQAKSPFKIPSSQKEADSLPEFTALQRPRVLAAIQSLLGTDLAGRVLIDIGCGWGAFLHHARNQGMKTIGFELTEPNTKFGKEVLNLDIRHQQFIEADDIAENSIDVIVMNHSLEHVPCPFEFLEKIEYVLKPGGVFFCMVPNFDSLCSQVMKEKWPWLERNWHYTHFTPKTLKDILAQAGFFIENLQTTAGDFGNELPTEIVKMLKPGLSETEYQRQINEFQRQGKGEQINVFAVKRGSSKGRIKVAQPVLTPVRSGEIEKVLIVRSDSIGDFVIFGTALQYYKQLYPKAAITLVVADSVADLADQCPYVDSIMTFNRAKMEQDMKYLAAFMTEIRQAQYDVAITPALSRDHISDFIVINSRATERIASFGDGANLTLEQLRENDQYFTRIIPAAEGIRLETERNEGFLRALGVKLDGPYEPTIWLTPEDIAFADRTLNRLRLDKPLVIAPFAQHRKRNWPVINWAKLVSMHPDQPIIICGVEADSVEAQKIIRLSGHPNIHNLCGRTTIRQLAAIISKAKVCVSCESAAAHIAAAIGTPHVVLLGGGHFGRFMPYAESTHMVCHKMKCFNCNWKCEHGSDVRCIYYIDVQAVEQKLTPILGSANNADSDGDYLVSAIVSTYNSESFIRGCLQDLVEQTLYQQGKLEIVVINSGSQQNEEAIVKEYQSKYPHIQYIKTERESIYAAWNRGARAAHGKYLTNANTDDRHSPDMLEKLAAALEHNQNVATVYAQYYVTHTPNQTWQTKTIAQVGNGQPNYNRDILLHRNYMGPFPMWRKHLHQEYGYFDDSMKVAGDYEFFLRVSQTHDFMLVPELLGLYYYNPNSLERSAGTHEQERQFIVNLYNQNRQNIIRRPFTPGEQEIAQTPLPLVSVIMPAYNAQPYIHTAVSSVLAQTHQNLELMIINDGSTDNTEQIVGQFNDPRIRLLNQSNAGPSAARNRGLQSSAGQFIVILDADDAMTPDFIAAHLQVFESHPDVDLIYCDDYLIDADGKPMRIIQRREYPNSNAVISDLFQSGFPTVPFRTCIRRRVFETIGLYDENLHVGEDYDMIRRLLAAGLTVRHLDRALYMRRIVSDSQSRRLSSQKAQMHFGVLERFIETFDCPQLFPGVNWQQLDFESKQLQFALLTSGVFLNFSRNYLKTPGCEAYAQAALSLAEKQIQQTHGLPADNPDLIAAQRTCQQIRLILQQQSRVSDGIQQSGPITPVCQTTERIQL